jgi:glutathione reductase (NADPH)
MVGGGYIAAEFSHIAARAGAKVTVLQRAERMLTRFDHELVGWLMEKFLEIGIEVQTGTAVEGIEDAGSGFRVRARAKSREIACSRLIGRAIPAILPANHIARQILVDICDAGH